MREIKFRGKKKHGGEWVYGYYALYEAEHIIIGPHIDSYKEAIKENKPMISKSVMHEIDYTTLGQYTGLKDKNGVEIYEGDVVLYEDVESSTENGYGDMFINKGVVEYCEENCCFNVTNRNNVELSEVFYEENDTLEVIGNIFDNKELLNGN